MDSRPPRLNVFAGPYIDRRTELRDQAELLAKAARDADALYVPVWQARNLFRREGTSALLLEAFDSLVVGAGSAETVFLGRFREHHCFLIELADGPEPPAHPAGEFRELRFYGSVLPADEAGLLAYARALAIWRRRNRFCSVCGTPTRSAQAGHVRACPNPDCGAEQFPRIDPAIIVLVTDGERALLGRQHSWPKDRYSTLAGFVEPGESLEDAVVREVREETGVHVRDVQYHSSQPWPFPSSLMLGFMARASGTDIVRADQELEDARWFSRGDIAQGSPILPPTQSISYRLIEDWYDSGSQTPLRETPGARLGVPTPSPTR